MNMSFVWHARARSAHTHTQTRYVALQRNVTAINGGSLQAQFHCVRQRLIQRTTTDGTYGQVDSISYGYEV